MEEDEEDILNVKTIIVGYFGNVFGNLWWYGTLYFALEKEDNIKWRQH
jgi:hypothetical protein